MNRSDCLPPPRYGIIVLGNISDEEQCLQTVLNHPLYQQIVDTYLTTGTQSCLEVSGTRTNGLAKKVADELGCKYNKWKPSDRHPEDRRVEIMHYNMCRYASSGLYGGCAFVFWNGVDQRIKHFVQKAMDFMLDTIVFIQEDNESCKTVIIQKETSTAS